MKHEKSISHSFGHGDAGKHRTHTIHGADHVHDAKNNISYAHGYGTPIRTVKSKHEHVDGAKGMESHGALHSSHPSHHGKLSTFGKDKGHASMKSDLGHNAYRPTC